MKVLATMVFCVLGCSTASPSPADGGGDSGDAHDDVGDVLGDVGGDSDVAESGDGGACATGLGPDQCPINSDGTTCPADCEAVRGALWHESTFCYGPGTQLVACVKKSGSWTVFSTCTLELATGRKFLTPIALPCPQVHGFASCGAGGGYCPP